MSKYTFKFYEGDYPSRQAQANSDGAICYVEHHFNSKVYDDASTGKDNPILTIVAHNASGTSKDWAARYSAIVQTGLRLRHKLEFPLFRGETPGVLQRAHRERGDYNLRFTDMPAILVEPMWVSDEATTQLLQAASTHETLAAALADSIVESFPNGGHVAGSIGHKGKTSAKYDRGAPFAYAEDLKKNFPGAILTEADAAEAVLNITASMLRGTWKSGTVEEPDDGQVMTREEMELTKKIKSLTQQNANLKLGMENGLKHIEQEIDNVRTQYLK
jgi:hypothetical protein